jgi:ABC-2 type transport system ATP-binding protein
MGAEVPRRLPTVVGRVGSIVETPTMFPRFTGRRNLEILGAIQGVGPKTVAAALETVGLAERADDRVKTYSLGMKQRLGIGAAMLKDPALLILDEPANGLDPQGVREMRTLIGGLAGTGRTVLVSSHDLSELEQVCDWLVLIDTGRSLYQGPTRAFLDDAAGGLALRPQYPDQIEPLLDLLVQQGLRTERRDDRLVVSLDDLPPTDIAAIVNRAAFEADIVLVELGLMHTTLEDRYLTLVQGGAR